MDGQFFFDPHRAQSFNHTRKKLIGVFDHFDNAPDLTIMVYSDNYFEPRRECNPILLSLFLAENGVIDFGIEDYVFFSVEEVDKFLEDLPQMSALEILFKSLGVRPQLN